MAAMKRPLRIWLAGAVLALGAATGLWAGAGKAAAEAERVANWREDLHALVAGLAAPGMTVYLRRGLITRGQKDFSKLYPAATFHPALETLESDQPRLTDAEIVLRFRQLVASGHVAHNGIDVPAGPDFRRLPVVFHWYADGLAVDAATADYSPARRGRVVTIGGRTPERLLAELAPFLAYENDAWLRFRAAEALREEETLRQLGLVDNAGQVTLTIEKPGQGTYPVKVAFAAPGQPFPLVPFTAPGFAAAINIPTPLFLSRPLERFYWAEYLPEKNTVYVQYAQCAENPQQPFDAFTTEVLALVDAHPVCRVILDLRGNGGGDSRVINPLRRGLESRRKKLGPVAVLIGPATFSSGVDNAIDLWRGLDAKLVGEPTGGSPRAYGEVMTFTLPHSGLIVSYTTKLEGPGLDLLTPSLEPDVRVPYTFEDARAGRDPLLERALALER
jgi:hypothetical protein